MDQVLMQTPNGPTFVKKPEWAYDEELVLAPEQVEEFNSTQFQVEKRLNYGGNRFAATIVFKDRGNIIFQFFNTRRKDFRSILAEVIETHFGSTDDFAASYEKELGAHSLLASGLQFLSTFSVKTHIEDFLELLDITLGELK